MVLPNKISFPFVDEVPLKVTSFKLKLNALYIIVFTAEYSENMIQFYRCLNVQNRRGC